MLILFCVGDGKTESTTEDLKTDKDESSKKHSPHDPDDEL